MPRRSTGCERCRQRKVRCDETKPQCRRCVDYGIECPGYRPPANNDLRFVDQTRNVARRAGFELVYEHTPRDDGTRMTAKQFQWRHNFYEPVDARKPGEINQSHMHRVQLLSTFLDLYLPKKRDETMMSNFTYISNLPLVDMSSPLLQVSIDTLCLVELGSLYEDERCLRESRARYVRALPMLSHELAKPSSRQMRKDRILAAITILAQCELFDAIAGGNDHRQGWINHVRGAEKYIQMNSADCVATHFGWLLFHNVRHSSLCTGFTSRKNVFFAKPEWLKITEETAKTDPFVALYDLAVQVPGMLERVDALSTVKSVSRDQASLCHDICQLRGLLLNWFQTHYLESDRDLYEIVDVRDMKGFASLCLDRTFQTVFRFPSVQICTQLQLFWICCVILDFALSPNHDISQIADPRSSLRLADYTERQAQDIERDLFVAATNYCRSVPYCCEPETASIGRTGSFLIRIVRSYFQQCGHCHEYEWCNSVRRMLDTDVQLQSQAVSVDTSPNTLASAPWNLKHKCKSPICNFRVECCAPAPLLMPDEFPNNEYIGDQLSGEDPTLISQDLGASKRRENLAYSNNNVGELGLSEFVPIHTDTGLASLNVHISSRKLNGASALADELIVQTGLTPSMERKVNALYQGGPESGLGN